MHDNLRPPSVGKLVIATSAVVCSLGGLRILVFFCLFECSVILVTSSLITFSVKVHQNLDISTTTQCLDTSIY
jgi:hypothetical protein